MKKVFALATALRLYAAIFLLNHNTQFTRGKIETCTCPVQYTCYNSCARFPTFRTWLCFGLWLLNLKFGQHSKAIKKNETFSRSIPNDIVLTVRFIVDEYKRIRKELFSRTFLQHSARTEFSQAGLRILENCFP